MEMVPIPRISCFNEASTSTAIRFSSRVNTVWSYSDHLEEPMDRTFHRSSLAMKTVHHTNETLARACYDGLQEVTIPARPIKYRFTLSTLRCGTLNQDNPRTPSSTSGDYPSGKRCYYRLLIMITSLMWTRTSWQRVLITTDVLDGLVSTISTTA